MTAADDFRAGRLDGPEIGRRAAELLKSCAPLPLSTQDIAAYLDLTGPWANGAYQALLRQLHRLAQRRVVEYIRPRGELWVTWAWIP